MNETRQLLRAYVEHGSEEAFRELVQMHLGLVHSTALRQFNGDSSLASDCAQIVFTDLARKAKSLPAHVVLAGWLYRHTRFTAAKLIRTEMRRRVREEQAMSALNEDPESISVWNQLEPMLDESLNWLSARDRDAVLMRFFQKQDFRSVAAALNVTEDAAQKRVERAVEKLRGFFQRRGVTVSGGALAAALTAYHVSTPSVSLAAAISASAVAATGAAVPLLTSAIESFLIMTKAKAIAVGTVAILGVTIPLFFQHQAISRLESENAALRARAQQLPPQAAPAVEDTTAAEAERRELVQLRGEVSRLRREQVQAASLAAENKRLRAQAKPSTPAAGQDFVPSDQWSDAGFGTPAAALQTAHWAVRTGNVEKFKESVFITDGARKVLHTLLEKMQENAPAEAIAEIKQRGWGAEEGLLFPMMALDRKHGFTGYRVVSENVSDSGEILFAIQTEMNSAPAQTRNLRMKQFGDSWRQVLDVNDLPLSPQEKALTGIPAQPQ